MSKSIRLIGAALLSFAFTAAAQDKPSQMEAFLGYTFTQFNSERNIPSYEANGGSGQFVYNFGDSFGAVMDLGAVHNGNIRNVHLDTTVADFLLGPRFAMHKWSRFTPYVQALFGGAYGTTSLGVSPGLLVHPTPLTTVIPPGDFLRAVKNDTCFAMTAGGGLDIKFSKHVSIRPFQLEYFLTEFHNPLLNSKNNQGNLRYSAGVNFTFGRAL
jgi:opacity protein-like surface antigen